MEAIRCSQHLSLGGDHALGGVLPGGSGRGRQKGPDLVLQLSICQLALQGVPGRRLCALACSLKLGFARQASWAVHRALKTTSLVRHN